MQKLFVLGLLVSFMVSMANASMSYECWAYKGGSPYKMVHVTADNKSEAVRKAEVKFENLGVNASTVKCK